MDAEVADIATGGYHTMLVLHEGEILSFGDGRCGKLGSLSNSSCDSDDFPLFFNLFGALFFGDASRRAWQHVECVRADVDITIT